MRFSFAYGLVALVACSFDTTGAGEGGGPSEGAAEAGTGADNDGAGPTGGSVATSQGPTTSPVTSSTAGTTASASGTDDGSSSTGSVGLGPFGAPEPVPAINSDACDDDPTLRADLLEIVFASNRNGSERLFSARRGAVSDVFDSPTELVDLSDQNSNVTTPELSLDGLVLIFGSNRPSSMAGSFDTYITTRPDLGSAWETPTRLGGINSSADDVGAIMTDDLLTVIFTRQLSGVYFGILRATRVATTDAFSGISEEMTLNMPDNHASAPWIDADASVIHFNSNRPGGAGLFDLWWAEHSGTRFEQPVRLEGTDLNTPNDETDPWLSPDLRTLFFTRSVGDGCGDIYVATR